MDAYAFPPAIKQLLHAGRAALARGDPVSGPRALRVLHADRVIGRFGSVLARRGVGRAARWQSRLGEVPLLHVIWYRRGFRLGAARSKMMDLGGMLKGQWVLVTGASSGLGSHFARLSAKCGARVVIAARRKDKLEALSAELRALGASDVTAIQLDVSDADSVMKAFEAIAASGDALDVAQTP